MNRKPQAVLVANERTEVLLRMTANINKFLYENRDATLTEKNVLHASEFMSATAGFEISPERAEAILSLYPNARIKLTVYGGLGDTEVRDLVADAIADFFLGCTWPVFADNVDIEKFCRALHRQAVEMGFA
jgi:hypothetical protein